MITHAEYHASNPLPAAVICCPADIERFLSPPPTGREHRLDDGIRDYRSVLTTEDYITALSNTAWRDSSYLAFALDIDQSTAKGRMLSPTMAGLTERKKMSGKWVWRLL